VCALNHDVIGIPKVVFDRVRGFDELVSGRSYTFCHR